MEKLIKHLAERQDLLDENNPHEHEWDHPVDDIENNLISSILYYIDGEGESHPNPLEVNELVTMLSTFTQKLSLIADAKVNGKRDSLVQYIEQLEKHMDLNRKHRVVNPTNQAQIIGNAKLQTRYKENKQRRDCAVSFLESLISITE